MPSLLDMRRRIKSVKNTQQITKAMKMVAAAKLKRAQDRVTAARPYAQKMSEILGNLSSRIGDEFSSPLLNERGDEKYLIVLVSADKGLAGAFNANVIKATQAFIGENGGKTIQMVPVGRKGRDFFKRREMAFTDEHVGLTGTGRVEYKDAAEIAQKIVRTFIEDETIGRYGGRRASRIHLRAVAGGNFRSPSAETDRNANLPRDARIGRFRAGFAHDGDGFGFEKRRRIDRYFDLEYEPHSSGGDHQGNHRSRLGRGGVVGDYELKITNV
jgi:hypothetical protein